jgi:uracil-DNA glycosylase
MPAQFDRGPDNRLAVPLSVQLAAPATAWGDWAPWVQGWRESAAGAATIAAVDARLEAGARVYPADPLRALRLTPRSRVRVVILGQDPYHGPGQAEGLAFSVPDGVPAPPSLRNIAAELAREAGAAAAPLHSLRTWAEDGVLLLNTSLTVEDGAAGSHAKLGWHALTSSIIKACVALESPVAFLLWGAHAQSAAVPALEAAVPSRRHGRFEANHPSPLSARRPPRPFIGCGHFAAANRFLAAAGRGTVAAWPGAC